jgi:transcription elongation factor GreA
MTDTHSRLENQILHFSKMGKWDKVEGLWSQLLEDPSPNAKVYATVAARAVEAGKTTEMRAWATQLIESCYSAGKTREVIQVSRGILHALPEFPETRQILVDSLRSQHANHPRLEEFFEASGLLTENSLYKPLNRFLQLVQCSEGQVFVHDHWGAGQVIRLEPDQERVVIRFQHHGEKPFSFDGVREFLKKIPAAHFLAQRLLHPKAQAKRAENAPVEFLKYCLKYLKGSITRAELKDELIQGIFDERQWNLWWSKNRDKFRFDPFIGFSGSVANPRLELRTEPKSFHEEMLLDFLTADTFARRYSIVMDIIKLREKEPIPAKVAARITQTLRDKYSDCDSFAIAARLEYSFLLGDLSEALGQDSAQSLPSPQSLLASSPDPTEAVMGISIHDYQVRTAALLRETAPDSWHENTDRLFLSGPMRLGQWVLRELMDAGDLETAAHISEQLLHRPYENPDLYLWLVRAIREGKLDQLHIDFTAEMIFASTMDLVDDCQRRIAHEDPEASKLKGLRARLLNLLTENHQALIVEAFEGLEIEEVRKRHRAIMDNASLNETFKLAFDSAVRGTCLNLEETAAADDATKEHFVTAESFETRQKEYLHIKNVEIPANSKAIGEAAALGDLSENAEYETAKDRQKVLFRRLEALEDLLHRARVLDADHISTNVIGFGTTFKVRDQDNGKVEQYTLLGLWDAEPEKHVLSYLTPFGKQFMNRAVNDTLVVNHPGGGSTRYTVLEIVNALGKGKKAEHKKEADQASGI